MIGSDVRLPLSFNQELLCMFDSGEKAGPFGPRYHIVVGRRLHGPLDVDTLWVALGDRVLRHEPLHTVLVRDPADRHQRVHPPAAPRLEVVEAPGLSGRDRDERAEALLAELEGGHLVVDEVPHLRAVLIRFAPDDAALILMTHHTATDGWSMGLIVRDLAALYAARCEGLRPDLPEVQSYRDFITWERERSAGPAAEQARAYW